MDYLALDTQTVNLVLIVFILLILLLNNQPTMNPEMPNHVFLVYLTSVFALLTLLVYLAYASYRHRIARRIAAQNKRWAVVAQNGGHNGNDNLRYAEMSQITLVPVRKQLQRRTSSTATSASLSQNGSAHSSSAHPVKVLVERDLSKSMVWTRKDVRTKISVSSNVCCRNLSSLITVGRLIRFSAGVRPATRPRLRSQLSAERTVPAANGAQRQRLRQQRQRAVQLVVPVQCLLGAVHYANVGRLFRPAAEFP